MIFFIVNLSVYKINAAINMVQIGIVLAKTIASDKLVNFKEIIQIILQTLP